MNFVIVIRLHKFIHYRRRSGQFRTSYSRKIRSSPPVHIYVATDGGVKISKCAQSLSNINSLLLTFMVARNIRVKILHPVAPNQTSAELFTPARPAPHS